jgi:hypothetical protein
VLDHLGKPDVRGGEIREWRRHLSDLAALPNVCCKLSGLVTEAFEGPMSNLQRYVAGEDDTLVGSVHDAIKTMAVVEACYASSADGATPIPGVKRE